MACAPLSASEKVTFMKGGTLMVQVRNILICQKYLFFLVRKIINTRESGLASKRYRVRILAAPKKKKNLLFYLFNEQCPLV